MLRISVRTIFPALLLLTSLLAPLEATTSGLPSHQGIPEDVEIASVVRIIDGDTIVVSLGDEVDIARLIGIDAPEIHHPNEPAECYGIESRDYLAALIPPGTTIHLESDVENRDRYGRLLRYLWFEQDDNDRSVLVNETLVWDGAAVANFYGRAPDYADVLLQAEVDAREGGRGIWLECGGIRPAIQETDRKTSGTATDSSLQADQTGACDRNYSPCVPIYPPDLDCRDVRSRVQVIGEDPHHLDGDLDGFKCDMG